MDEIWQRHKTFILQVLIGAIVFLIALAVMSQSFSGPQDDPAELAAGNRSRFSALKAMVDKKEAPSPRSIEEQKRQAKQAEEQIRQLASEVASFRTGDEYVRESLDWIAGSTGRSSAEVDTWFGLYKQLPQTCLSKVREEVRASLVGRAAQTGRLIDENLGLTQGFEDAEVPLALHGLAVVADVIARALELDGITAVGDLRIIPQSPVPSDYEWLTGLRVRLSVTGHPDAVMKVFRSFNGIENRMRRMTVLDTVESFTRPRKEDDLVKLTTTVQALQYKGAETAQEGR